MKVSDSMPAAAPQVSAICAGAQKELHQWPIFQELLTLMPDCSFHIHFFSPEMPNDLDGSSKWTSMQQGTCTSWLCLDATGASKAVGSSSAVAATYISVQPLADNDALTQTGTGSADDSRPYHHSVPYMAGRMQQGTEVPPGQAAMQDNTTRITSKVSTLQLTFHKGFYHDVTADSDCDIKSADLVFGANAGELVVLHTCLVRTSSLLSLWLPCQKLGSTIALQGKGCTSCWHKMVVDCHLNSNALPCA